MNHIYTGLDIGNGEIKIVVVSAINNKTTIITKVYLNALAFLLIFNSFLPKTQIIFQPYFY